MSSVGHVLDPQVADGNLGKLASVPGVCAVMHVYLGSLKNPKNEFRNLQAIILGQMSFGVNEELRSIFIESAGVVLEDFLRMENWKN